MRLPYLAALLLLLSGCASLRPVPAGNADALWQQHRAQLEQIDRFSLQARIASGSLGMKADLHWQQFAEGDFDLRVAGPFGAGALGIRGDARRVEVRSREGSSFTTEPEQWLKARLGWTLPIGELRYWALGLPAPGAAARLTLDAEGRLAALEQDGWQLQYEEYQAIEGRVLPRRFQLINEDATIRVIADRWDELPGPASTP